MEIELNENPLCSPLSFCGIMETSHLDQRNTQSPNAVPSASFDENLFISLCENFAETGTFKLIGQDKDFPAY